MLKIPPGVTTGNRLRIRGKGVQSSSGIGNQIVQIKIMMPKKIDQELQAAVRNWKNKFDYDPRGSESDSVLNQRNEKSENQPNI